MGETKLEELCESLSELCDIPDTRPGDLYGLRRAAGTDPSSAVSALYTGAVASVRTFLKSKGIHPEDELIHGFDHEQHFQQVALISQESAACFLPQIAFAETQVKDIRFPIENEKELENQTRNTKDGGSSEEEHDDHENDVDNIKLRQDTAISDSEIEDDGTDEGENSEDLFDLESEGDADVAEENDKASLSNDDEWDQVEGKDPAKAKAAEQKNELSSYEKSRKKMMCEIETLEEKQLEEKPWQLKGDVQADKRPYNSLLEEVLEYDVTQRPAPVITEAVTLRLEDIILKRIKDRAFDDVERKIKPVDAPPELKKKIVLDQEKSKLSLAEVYEQEYVKQKNKATSQIEGAMPSSVVPEVELSKEEKDINARLSKLFAQLDCLSNFHYAPPPRLAEMEIVANLPAINVEEVGQDALTSANLLTPGEVAGTLRREIKAPSEKTKTDKKRERRKKKVHQAKKFQKLQLTTSVKTAQPTSGKKKMKLADPALKSSTAFFTHLESQAKNIVDSRKRQADDDKKARFKAKKLKM